MEKFEVIQTLLERQKSAGETRALRLYRGLYAYEYRLGLNMEPSLPWFSRIHHEGLAPDVPPRPAA